MKIIKTAIADLLIIEPTVYHDERGYFMEQFHLQKYQDAIGHDVQLLQDNFSSSRRNVLRGLHFQHPSAQGKLIQVTSGEIYDVVVDMRPHSSSFGQWVATLLSDSNHRQLWVPAGFAHGFLTLSERADTFYKTTAYYAPQNELTLAWDDPDLAIEWPIKDPVIMSTKDRVGQTFAALRTQLTRDLS